MAKDNFDQAIETLYSLTVLLYGDYYESKSERDKELADELNAIYMKHAINSDCKFPEIFNPRNAHSFIVEAARKAFKHVKLSKQKKTLL